MRGEPLSPPPEITTTSLLDGQVTTAYSQTVLATSGTTPYSWSIKSGSLPAGLSLTSSTGVISGTPTTEGTSNFTIKVTDVNARTDNQSLSIVVAPPSYSNTILNTSGLVSYWQMNSGFVSGADVLDSKGTNHGTKTGATLTITDYVDGGGAGSFDGSGDYVDCGVLSMPGVITISVWIKLNSDYSSIQPIISNYQPGNYLLEFGRIDGEFSWLQNGGSIDAVSSVSLLDNDWHHLAVVRTGSSGNWIIAWYLDGVFDETDITSANPGAPSTTAIGRHGTGGADYFNGAIDEVAIYDRALSESEILEHCNAAGKITCGE